MLKSITDYIELAKNIGIEIQSTPEDLLEVVTKQTEEFKSQANSNKNQTLTMPDQAEKEEGFTMNKKKF